MYLDMFKYEKEELSSMPDEFFEALSLLVVKDVVPTTTTTQVNFITSISVLDGLTLGRQQGYVHFGKKSRAICVKSAKKHGCQVFMSF